MIDVAPAIAAPAWVRWAGPAAAAWSAALAGLAWTWAGGQTAGFPLADWTSPEPPVIEVEAFGRGALAVAGVGLLVSIAMTLGARTGARLALAIGGLLSVLLTVVAPGRLLLDALNAATLEAVHPVDWSGFAGRLFCAGGGMLWILATVASHRRGRGLCPRCGVPPGAAQPYRRWWRWVSHAAALAPLPYGLQRLAWIAGLPVGISAASVDYLRTSSPGVAGLVALVVLSETGALLTHGLWARWGEVVPRWVPLLGGRPIPPRLVIVPAATAALLLTSITGFFFATMGGTSDLPGADQDTAGQRLSMDVLSLGLLVWGPLLALATVAYASRRRGQCRHVAQPAARL